MLISSSSVVELTERIAVPGSRQTGLHAPAEHSTLVLGENIDLDDSTYVVISIMLTCAHFRLVWLINLFIRPPPMSILNLRLTLLIIHHQAMKIHLLFSIQQSG